MQDEVAELTLKLEAAVELLRAIYEEGQTHLDEEIELLFEDVLEETL
jgi:hypothetical protein